MQQRKTTSSSRKRSISKSHMRRGRSLRSSRWRTWQNKCMCGAPSARRQRALRFQTSRLRMQPLEVCGAFGVMEGHDKSAHVPIFLVGHRRSFTSPR